MRLLRSFSLSITFAALLFGAAARAEMPQVLALLSAPDGIPVQCSDGRCAVELATLCLQPERLAPDVGQSYDLNQTDGLALTVRKPGGETTTETLPAETSIEVLRTHVAVRLSFPASDAGTVVSVQIAKARLLLPDANGGQPSPKVAALAKDERQALMQRILADDPDRHNALTLSRRVINQLGQTSGTADYDRAWDRHMADVPIHGQNWQLARVQRDFCGFGIEQGLYPTPADCLRAQQDGVMDSLYSRFVAALSAGS